MMWTYREEFFYDLHFVHELQCNACTAIELGPEVPEIHS